MKRSRIYRYLFSAGLCFGIAASALADDHPRIPEPAEPPVVPEAFATVREKLEICFDCHGAGGYAPDPTFPILSGQEFYYLYVQLKDFKAARRASEIMGPIASGLERAEMKQIAQYFSTRPWPNIGYKGDEAKVLAGERAAAAGQCVQCHLGSYKGNSRIPRVAGQYPEYLRKTLSDFKTKTRLNSPAKSSLMGTFSDEDLEAMADFMANM